MPDRDVRKPGWHAYQPRKPRQIGRRGAVLLILGLIWIILGLGVLDSGGISDELLHERLSPTLRGAAWIVTGLVAIGYAFRPTGLGDQVGFAALYLMPAVRVASYTTAWVDSLIPVGGPGYESGWRFAAIHAAIVTAVAITAGWPEPPRTPRPEDDRAPEAA